MFHSLHSSILTHVHTLPNLVLLITERWDSKPLIAHTLQSANTWSFLIKSHLKKKTFFWKSCKYFSEGPKRQNPSLKNNGKKCTIQLAFNILWNTLFIISTLQTHIFWATTVKRISNGTVYPVFLENLVLALGPLRKISAQLFNLLFALWLLKMNVQSSIFETWQATIMVHIAL